MVTLQVLSWKYVQYRLGSTSYNNFAFIFSTVVTDRTLFRVKLIIMCKSTSLGPVQADTAKVEVTEDNSSSFINVHLPSMTYLGAAVLLVIFLVIVWKWMSAKRKKTAHQQRVRELELKTISRNVLEIPHSSSAMNGEDTVRVTMTPTSRMIKALEQPAF